MTSTTSRPCPVWNSQCSKPSQAWTKRATGSACNALNPQLGNVREVDAGQGVDQVGLGGTDGVRDLGTGAKGAPGCHAVIVRLASQPTALDPGHVPTRAPTSHREPVPEAVPAPGGVALQREAVRSLFGFGWSQQQSGQGPPQSVQAQVRGSSQCLESDASPIGAWLHQLVHYHEGLTPSAVLVATADPQVTVAHGAER